MRRFIIGPPYPTGRELCPVRSGSSAIRVFARRTRAHRLFCVVTPLARSARQPFIICARSPSCRPLTLAARERRHSSAEMSACIVLANWSTRRGDGRRRVYSRIPVWSIAGSVPSALLATRRHRRRFVPSRATSACVPIWRGQMQAPGVVSYSRYERFHRREPLTTSAWVREHLRRGQLGEIREAAA